MNPTGRLTLQAGAWTAILEDGGLRRVRWSGVEIVRGIYCAVRDRDWGTVPADVRYTRVETTPERFEVRFRATHREGDIAFSWDGEIDGDASGTICFRMAGTAETTFERSRIGFCVLHPMEQAGIALIADTDAGEARAAFPEEISPHQPLTGIRALRFSPAAGMEARIAFEGDVFEMEDQRNWTDASYKTYCTPLSLPYPVRIGQGERVAQQITVRATGGFGERAAAEPEPVTLALGTERSAERLPALGTSLAKPIERLTETEIEAFRELRLSYLHAELSLDANDWRERLANAIAGCRALGAGLVVEAVAGDRSEAVGELAERLAEARDVDIVLYPFDRRTHLVPEASVEIARHARDRANGTFRIGGGTRAHFAELNRAERLPEGIGEVSFSISPQVHAFDDESIMETLGAQRVAAANAVRLAAGLPLRVGPVTFKQRYNPVGTSEANEVSPPAADARQHTLFGASWVLGSIRACAAGGASAIAYASATGESGLLVEEGRTPIYALLESLAPYRSGEIVGTRGGPEGLVSFALRDRGRLRLWLSNTTAESLETEVALPARMKPRGARLLDEGTIFREMRSFEAADERIRLPITPYAIAMFDLEIV